MKGVLLVGATDGIGRALARSYLEEGWRVGVVGRSREKLDRVSEELAEEHPDGWVSPVRCDVTDSAAVPGAFEEALRKLGHLHLMVYCAGLMAGGDSAGERYAATARMLEVNLAGAVHFLELAADYFAAAGRGHLAAIGSVAGDRGRKGNPGYGASKAGLHAYVEGLRHRLHGRGVRVSAVKPGWVNTRMLARDRAAAIEPEDAARRIRRGLRAGKEVFYVPAWWRVVSLGLRLTPRWLYKRIAPA